MIVAIIGSGGFLGKQLMLYLLENTDYSIRAIAHHKKQSYDEYAKYAGRLSFLTIDIFDTAAMTNALQVVDVAYYFVQMMGQDNVNFYDHEAAAAESFSIAVEESHVARVVFMGGLGNENEKLSLHLASRHNNGKILREKCPLVLELRASMIIGSGSLAFDIIDNLVRKVPIMLLPSQSETLTQPIALADALRYLQQAAIVPLTGSTVIEIGGPTVLSYKQLYKLYAHWLGRHQLLIRAHFIPESLAGYWLDHFIPKVHAHVGRIMVDSMNNSMVVTDKKAATVFPTIQPSDLTTAFEAVASTTTSNTPTI